MDIKVHSWNKDLSGKEKSLPDGEKHGNSERPLDQGTGHHSPDD
jgi:hypothetical protein